MLGKSSETKQTSSLLSEETDYVPHTEKHMIINWDKHPKGKKICHESMTHRRVGGQKSLP